MRTTRLPIACAAVALMAICAACASDESADSTDDARPAASDTPRVEQPPLPPAPEPRADSMRDTVMLEGMPEPITLRLYESPPEAPVPFSVYLPPAFDAEAVSAGELMGVRLAADFANTGEAPGWVEILFHPVGTSEAEARETLRRAAEPPGAEPRELETAHFTWALEERSFTQDQPDGTLVWGTVALGQHAERFFQLTMRYPAEWADGFGPRASLMLDSWRWGSGERLSGIGNS